MHRLIALVPLALLLAACETETNNEEERFDALQLIQHVGRLASDDFGGRAPGSTGENRTVEYIAEQFGQMGLEPGNGEDWYQQVPLVQITANPEMTMRILGGDEPLELEYGSEMMAFTRRTMPEVRVENSELVFAGYGIVAPEYDWNDYEDLDVEGKTVVVLVNDPGFATQDSSVFNGNAMTYYGRWSYKYEEAARQGATGVIIVHETDAAGYPWEVVSGSWSGPQFDLAGNADEYRLPLQAWVTREVAEQLFENAGFEYAALKERSLTPDFEPVSLQQNVSINIQNAVEQIQSRNVIARLPGFERADETILYTAHWDHLGTDPDLEGDTIYNGAVDNASGVAGLLELARAFSELEEPPARSVAFLAVTAEESGLLGSKWYAENPLYPLEKTVAVINMDSANVYGPTSDVVVVGHGNSELEEILARKAEAQDREVVPEEHPERGYYYRSDHFNFAKMGVPALYAESGSSYIGENAEEAAARAEAYTEEHYHKPSDEYADWWDLRGMVEDLELYYEIGMELAESEEFPNWYEGNEFRAIRDQSADSRQSD